MSSFRILLHPVLIFVLVWSAVLISDQAMQLLRPGYFYSLSVSTVIYIFAASFFWVAGYLFASAIPLALLRSISKYRFGIPDSYRQSVLLFIFSMMVLVFFTSIERYIFFGSDFFTPESIMNYRIRLTVEGGEAMFKLVSILNFFYFLFPALTVCWFFSGEKVSKWILILGYLVFFYYLYLSTSRSAFFYPVIAAFFAIMLFRFRVQYVAILVVLLVLSFGVLGALVGKAGFEKIIFYALSPIHAFDRILNGEINYDPGFLSFRFLHPLLVKIGLIERPLVELANILTPKPTNVFTIFGVFYLDFGLYGSLLMLACISFVVNCFYRVFMFFGGGYALIILVIFYTNICLGVFYDYFTSTFFVYAAIVFGPFVMPGKIYSLRVS